MKVVAHQAVGSDAHAGKGLELAENGAECLFFGGMEDDASVNDARDAVMVGRANSNDARRSHEEKNAAKFE
jgi:hypothetical protein